MNVDVTTMIEGFHGDTSATFVIGAASPTSAQFEHSVVVTKEGCEVTTRLDAVEDPR